MRPRSHFAPWLFFSFPLLVLIALWIVPLGKLILLGLSNPMETGWWKDRYLLHVVGLTYVQAALSASLSAGFGLWGALIYSEQKFRGRTLLWRLSLVSFSLPAILAASALIGLWGQRGWISKIVGPLDGYGWPLVLAAHVFFNFPLFFRNVGTALERNSREEERAALGLGASRWLCFWQITFFKISAPFFGAWFLAFLYCSASFLVILLLGGGPRFTTIEVEIYQATKINLDLAEAVRLAMVQVFVCFAVYTFLLEKGATREKNERSHYGQSYPLYRFDAEWKNRSVRAIWFLGLLALVAGPLMTLIWEGFPSLGSLDLARGFQAFKTSLILALGAGLLSTALAFGVAYFERHSASLFWRRFASVLGTLPLSVSTILVALSLSLTFPGVMAALRGSLWPIIVIQSLVALPLVYRPLRDGFLSIGDPLYRSAEMLGADAWTVAAHLEFPLLRKAAVLSLLLGMAFSLGELGAVMMFYSEELLTLPLWMYQLMSQYRFSEASGVGCLLLLTMGGVYALAGKLES
jgi:thiamine transport system permease protein